MAFIEMDFASGGSNMKSEYMNECEVGTYNGKTLYRKTLACGTISADRDILDSTFTTSYFDEIVEMSGSYTKGTNTLPFPDYNGSGWYIYPQISTIGVQVRGSSQLPIDSARLTVYYTKP